MTRNNMFFSVDCSWLKNSRLCSVLALKRAGFSLAAIQSDVILPHACVTVGMRTVDNHFPFLISRARGAYHRPIAV